MPVVDGVNLLQHLKLQIFDNLTVLLQVLFDQTVVLRPFFWMRALLGMSRLASPRLGLLNFVLGRINYKSNKSKTPTLAAVFVPNDCYVNNANCRLSFRSFSTFNGFLKVRLDIRFFSRIENASDEILDVNRFGLAQFVNTDCFRLSSALVQVREILRTS